MNNKFPINPLLWCVYTGVLFVVSCIANWYAVPCLSWSTIQAAFAIVLVSPFAIPALGRWVGVKK